ncbi:FixH family protein [Thalassovita sp.]|uniref:FixH family protein n=1 Tax=Thalassovita sp. TaxID=1979401 RepID=UPI002AB262BD|nr:FixH family protein [Thalassovita sp.]
MQSSTAKAPEARIQFEPPQISQPFVVRVALFDGGQVLTVDAIMPAHQHGMLYRPSMSTPEQGRYTVENLVFHMPGLWHIQVQAEVDARRIDYVYETVVQ